MHHYLVDGWCQVQALGPIRARQWCMWWLAARAMNGAVQVGTASVTSAPVVNHGYGLGLFYLAVDLGTNPCPIRSSLSFKVSATNAKGTGSAGSGAAYQVNPFLHTTFDCTP